MPHTRTADEAAIQAVLDASYKGWDAGDAAAMVADYTDDATAIMPGSLGDGRDAIRQNMSQAFAGPLKGTSTSNRRLGLRFTGPDTAIVTTESAIIFPGETEAPDSRKVNATWVLQRHDGRWLIAAYHNSPVHPQAQ